MGMVAPDRPKMSTTGHTEWDGTPTCDNWGSTTAGQKQNPNCRCRMCQQARHDKATYKKAKKK